MMCPICKEPIQDYEEYGQYFTEELYATCNGKKHTYHYRYSYGNTEENIQGNVVWYAHDDTSEHRALTQKMRELAIELARLRMEGRDYDY